MPGLWISNITDGGGPSQEGTAYGIRWEPQTTGINYTIFFRELPPASGDPHFMLMPVSLKL